MRRRLRRQRGSRRGVALIMVLAAIAVLTVMLAEFQDEASSELSGALTDRDALKAEYLARSGVNLSRLLIAAEPTIRTAIAPLFMMMRMKAPQIPVWEFSDRVLGAFNDEEGGQEFTALAGVDLSEGKNLGIKDGRFEVVIVDEDAKLNMNIAARGDAFSEQRLALQLVGLMMGDQYNPLFEQRDQDGQYSDRLSICSALIDWADPDENLFSCDVGSTVMASTTGSEDAFYSFIKPPYRRKNAAYDSLEELRMVRGVGDDFWATFIDPEPGNPKKRVATVWGQGAVNVNTANPQTLLAVVCAAGPQSTVCTDPAKAQTFLMVVGLIRNFTAGAPLFGSPKEFIKVLKGQGLIGPMFASLGIEPVQFLSESEAEKMITTESKVFSIYADGIVPGFRRKTRVRIHTVVDFRAAPAPGYAPVPGTASTGGSTTGTAPGSINTTSGAGSGTTATQGIAAATAPNPGGSIIYWRIE
jgi:general secretion pathway protein K